MMYNSLTLDKTVVDAVRAFRPEDNELEDDTNASNKFLGVNKIYEGTFPNIEMDTVPHLRLVQFIESAIKESEPDVIITHHPADTNNDHLRYRWYAKRLFSCYNAGPR